MRKLLIALSSAALVVSTAAAPAVAAKKATTLYLHGRGPATEAYINETWIDSNWMSMDTTEPSNPYPSSMNVTNYVTGPNTDCNGNGLLPVWKGNYVANFKGTVKVTLNTVATPNAQMTVSLYPDPTGQCTSNLPTGASEAPPPAATSLVDVAPGQAETVVEFKNIKFKAVGSLALQLSMPGDAAQIRILFDSPDFASNVSLSPK